MIPLIRFACVLLFMFSIPGCATLLNGRTEKVVISSEPSGAILSVDGTQRGTTPAVVSVARKAAHTVKVEMSGYAPADSIARTKAHYGRMALNLLLVHPAIAAVGIGVDFATGAHRHFEPWTMAFRLTPLEATPRTTPAHVAWQPAPLGSRIRVSAAGSPALVAGTLSEIAGDTLRLITLSSDVRSFSRQSLRTIELGIGPDRVNGLTRWVGKGALVGVAIGASIGALTHGAEGAYFFGALFGLPGGLILGSVAGAVIRPDEKWVLIK